ncbi:MAG: macro domain-containing protein [Candidatus Krumholzibacteriia bacterium]
MGAEVEIVLGSIVEQDVEVIVNSANTSMVMGGGVAAAILAEAGPEVEEEAVQNAPVQVGDVVVTSGGRLSVKHIVHIAVVGEVEPDIYECTRTVLDTVSDLGVRTIAMPALGTGSAGMDPETCARDMFHAILDFEVEADASLLIRIVLWDEELYPLFRRELDRA